MDTAKPKLKELWNYFVGGTFNIGDDYDKSFEYAEKLGLFSLDSESLKTELTQVKSERDRLGKALDDCRNPARNLTDEEIDEIEKALEPPPQQEKSK